jgi:Raf kinase inhibitor-like YbhB/YbcL family protein
MELKSTSFGNGEWIPERCAFARPDPDEHIAFSDNRSPHVAWSDLPEGTRSLVVVMHDSDAPAQSEGANREDRVLSADLARTTFDHWVLVDVDPGAGELAEGALSKGVTKGGKDGPESPGDTRSGLNDYTAWFSTDPEMSGRYYGYDGPCPPWNDEKIHAYHLTVYALDMAPCPVEGTFTRSDVLEAIRDHVLDEATISGFYSLNPDVR